MASYTAIANMSIILYGSREVGSAKANNAVVPFAKQHLPRAYLPLLIICYTDVPGQILGFELVLVGKWGHPRTLRTGRQTTKRKSGTKSPYPGSEMGPFAEPDSFLLTHQVP